MTEREWLESDDPTLFLEFLRSDPKWRKLRLFVVACARIDFEVIGSNDFRNALEAAEQYAEGIVSDSELREHRLRVVSVWEHLEQQFRYFGKYVPNDQLRVSALTLAATQTSAMILRFLERPHWIAGRILMCETRTQFLKDIFGNPFRPVTLDPRWLTSTVIDLARSRYEGFPRQAGGDGGLAILSDALMDAGCDDEQIIQHCRSEGPHVRGCWVVDLLLGKS